MDSLAQPAYDASLRWDAIYYPLHFKRPAKTSRNTLHQKPTWFLRVRDEHENQGLGEVSIIEGLSVESIDVINAALSRLTKRDTPFSNEELISLPALRFAIEMAISDLKSPTFGLHFSTPFSTQEAPIAINGLIWMGEKDFMLSQIKQKINEGFDCIKLKIGGIDFEEEIKLLAYIRKEHGRKEIELRLDANGAFSPANALERLKRLSDFDIHSIEQPIKQKQPTEMAMLCEQSPIDIALDEELIACFDQEEKARLLETIRPPFIVLKPSILGGWKASDEWIETASRLGINYWVTSALESNLGLNAIVQWISTKKNDLWQGLGTGGLYTNNIESPLCIDKGQIHYSQSTDWQLGNLQELWRD